MLFVLVAWKLWLCRRQILLKHLVGNSTLSFVVSCIFSLSPFAVLRLKSPKLSVSTGIGFLGKTPVSGGVCSYMMQTLELEWPCPAWVDLCSAHSAACCGPWHVLAAAMCGDKSHSLTALGAMAFVRLALNYGVV